MILLSVTSAALAVLFCWPPSGARHLDRRLGSGDQERFPRSHARLVRLTGGLAVLLGVLALAATAGMRAAVLGAAGLILAGTTGVLVRQQVRTRRALRVRTQIAQACAALAAQLRVGRVPTEALRSTAADWPVLAPAVRALQIGSDPAEQWRRDASRPGHQGLADLSQAWRVSADTGAPLAPALEQVAEALTADAAVRQLVAGELSAPRATSKIMAVLPGFGIGIGYAIGGQPLAFLLQNPYGWGCLLGGVALAATGVLWVETLARRAAEEG